MNNLPLEEVPSWQVVQLTRHCELRYGGILQARASSPTEVSRLRAIASFCNRKKLAPRDHIECAADAPNPALYLRKISL